MLSALEGRITSVVNDVVGNDGAAVIRAPQDFSGIQAGGRMVRIALAELSPGSRAFHRESFDLVGSEESPAARRFVQLELLARLEFRALPLVADQMPTARRLLLEDISRVSHRLGAADARDGTVFRSAEPDPGFAVETFELAEGQVEEEVIDGGVRGELRYRVTARVWPPGEPEELGRIDAVDPFVAAQPVAMTLTPPLLAPGEEAQLLIRGLGGQRLEQVDDGTRAPVRLAVSVASDLPPAERGTVLSGDAGDETGVRLVDAGEVETVVTYRAPADPAETRVEFVVVHLATPENRRGLLLGSAAVRLREAPA